MNKIAGIYHLMELGLPTLDITILSSRNPEKEIARAYRDLPLGWVARCGENPDYNANPERPLPWEVAASFDGLVDKVKELRNQVGNKLLIFVHPQRKMDRAGNLLILGNEIILEGCNGPYTNLARLAAGKDNPEQFITFNPWMIGVKKKEGMDVFSVDDLYQIRCVERMLSTPPNSSVQFEFSFNGSRIDVHDITILY